MLTLYGFAASNYFNMVKLALLEKQLPFQVVPLFGCQSPEVLAVSARGRCRYSERRKASSVRPT